MTATVHTPSRGWVRAHLAALTIVLLSIALAASLSLLVVRLTSGATPIPVTTVSGGDIQPTDNGCQVARPGQPC
jgi:hypothetical protein